MNDIPGLTINSIPNFPSPANSNMPPIAPYNPGGGAPAQTPAYLNNILQGHIDSMNAMLGSLARVTDPGSRYYNPQSADILRQNIAQTSNDIEAVRARFGAAGPKLMPPTMVGHPGSGGILNEEQMLQRARENLTPPRQND